MPKLEAKKMKISNPFRERVRVKELDMATSWQYINERGSKAIAG
jgi:hypothetical protein